MLDIGITLRKYRDSYGYTQQFVADCIGISRVSYRKWENNSVEFTITQLQKIADFYNILVDQLIKDSYVYKGSIRFKPKKAPLVEPHLTT